MSKARYAHEEQQMREVSPKKDQVSLHKRFYLALASVAAAVAVLTLCTCILLAGTAAPETTDSSSDEPSSAEVSSEFAGESSETSSLAEESDPTAVGSTVASASPQAGSFGSNPIDAALEKAEGEATNTIQLLNAYESALNAWKSELTKEVARLKRVLPDSVAFVAEQSAWEQKIEAADIQSGSDGEGSTAQLNRVHAACDAYRERVKELYARLIVYEPGYVIA